MADDERDEVPADDADPSTDGATSSSPVTDALSGMLGRAGLTPDFFASLGGIASASDSYQRLIGSMPEVPEVPVFREMEALSIEPPPSTSEQVGWALEPVLDQLEALSEVMRTQAEMQRGLLEQQERDRVEAQRAAAEAQAANDRRARHALIPAWVSIGVAIVSLGVAVITIFG
jgi:hypothetical protein